MKTHRSILSVAACFAMFQTSGLFAADFTNEFVSLTFDAKGNLTSLRENLSKRELVGEVLPFVEARDAANAPIRPVAVKRRGDLLEFSFPQGSCSVRLIPFDGGWTVECVSCDVPGAEKLVLAQVRPSCDDLKGGMSNAVVNHYSGVVVRGYGPEVEMSDPDVEEDYRGAIVSRKTCAWVSKERGFKGARAGIAAGPYEKVPGMLRAMAVAKGGVRSACGGPWSLDAEASRASYLFGTWMDATSVDDWVRLMEKSGCRLFHFHAWWKTRGHYEPDPTCFPNGMDEIVAACEKFRARGMQVGTHTLSAMVQFGDPFVDPKWFDDFETDAEYTLARPYRRGDAELWVNERPWKGHARVLTGGTNGNILRIDDNLLQYDDFTTEPPYRFTGVRMAEAPYGKEKIYDDTQAVESTAAGGAADAKAVRSLSRAEYPAGFRVSYLHHRYAEFSPKPGSKLAEAATDRIADVFNRCGMVEIYFDGSEACNSDYSINWLRDRTFSKLRQPASGIVNSASVRRPQHWWYRSFVGGWDHPNFCPKRFHDRHISVYANAARADFIRTDLGWWNIRSADENARGYFPDEAEYFGCKCAANDATTSVMGAMPTDGPLKFSSDMQLTITGWWEKLRYARAFAPGVQERMRPVGKEFRLRQDQSGTWCVTPYEARRHRVATADFAKWTERFNSRRPAEIRVEALYASDRAAGAPLRVLDASHADGLRVESAAGVKARFSKGSDQRVGETLRFEVENDGAPEKGSWARLVRTLPLKAAFKAGDVTSLWVKGDGSGAVVNFQLGSAPEYGLSFSENFVTLDFNGWRRVDLLLRERDADMTFLYEWPYENAHNMSTPGAVFRASTRGRRITSVSVYVNGVAKGSSAAVEFGAWDMVPQTRGRLAAGAELSINGDSLRLPFALEGGEYAELADGAWTHYAESGEPLERVVSDARPEVRAGDNAIAFAGDGGGRFPRAEVTIFPTGDPEPALARLSAAQRNLLSVEYELPRIHNPEKGLDGSCDVRVRPGSRATLGFEILGPAKNPSVAGRRMQITLESVADKIVCEDGRAWQAVRIVPGANDGENRVKMSRRIPLGSGAFDEPLVVDAGTTRVKFESEVPGARVTFVKRYDVSRPLVAVADSCSTNEFAAVDMSVLDEVAAAGASPVLLPETASEDAVRAVFDRVDMLFIPTAGPASPRRAKWEHRLRRLADYMRVPYYDAGRVAEFCAGVATGKAPARRRRYRLVAVPDYCFTNGVSVIKANMVDALEKAGFFPYVIPFTADDKVLSGYLEPADALLVAGGYKLQDYVKRSEFEVRAIKLALGRSLPIAGVCHGEQIINVAMGGKLATTPQKAGVENPQILHRRTVSPWTDNYHAAETVAGSRIAAVLGTGTVVVNSSHSRCIGEVAPGMKATALAPDGVVEAIEHETLPIMAFQFHPERMTFDDRMVELVRTALSPRVPSPPADSLVVGTWNIRSAGMDNWQPNPRFEKWYERAPRLAAFIREKGYDVIGLQEVGDPHYGTFKESLGEWEIVGETTDPAERKLYVNPNPILVRRARVRVLCSGRFTLSETPEIPDSKSWDSRFIRSCTWALLEDRLAARPFLFMSVHLDNIGRVARRMAVKLILSRIPALAEGAPAIVVGDFNAVVESPEIRLGKSEMDRAFEISLTPPTGPFRTDNCWDFVTPSRETAAAGHRIDHILVAPGTTVYSHETFGDYYGDDFYPSDHFPLRAVITLGEKAP